MGTTCTVVGLKGDHVFLAHVGDSRCYLIRGGDIRRLSQDHSLVAQLVARGQLTPEQAKVDPRRNVVTRSVGVEAAVDVDAEAIGAPLQPGDTLLVCSDGLHGQVGDADLARIGSGESLERACRELIALANQNGGPDNITVAMARLEPVEDEERPVRRSALTDATPPRGVPAASRRESRAQVPPPAPARATRRPAGGANRSATLRWLIIAMVVLLVVLCGAIAIVVGMMQRDKAATSSREVSAQTGEAIAWR